MPCKPAANGPAAQFAGHGRRYDRGIDDPWVRRRRIASVISFLPRAMRFKRTDLIHDDKWKVVARVSQSEWVEVTEFHAGVLWRE